MDELLPHHQKAHEFIFQPVHSAGGDGVRRTLAMLFGFGGMLAKRSANPVLKTFGVGYTNMVRGIPDIVIFMFVPLAVDMGIELLRHAVLCPSATTPIFKGVNFTPCRAANSRRHLMPNGSMIPMVFCWQCLPMRLFLAPSQQTFWMVPEGCSSRSN